MKLYRSFFLILLLAAAARADLAGDVKSILNDKLLQKAQSGVHIVRLSEVSAKSRTLVDIDGRIPRIPASNLKIITTSAALHTLGDDFKFQTVLLYHDGDLILRSDGDPTLGDAELLKNIGWSVDTTFNGWAEQMRTLGIGQVRNVLVDDSAFDEQFLHPRWPVDQEHKRYVAQVAGINLNANCLDVMVEPRGVGDVVRYSLAPATKYVTVANACVTGHENAIWLSRKPGTNDIILRGQTISSAIVPVAVTIHDPALYAGTVLSETLLKNGIKRTGTVQRDRSAHERYEKKGPQDKWAVLAIHETPLATVLARANKDSVNLYAEALCKRLGYSLGKGPGSWENGIEATDQFLQRARVPSEEFTLDDGSGLSKENRISPAAITRVLSFNFASDHRDAFLASMSVGGVDGTLDNRFTTADLRGRVFAKSGFVNGVSGLSGYLKGKDDQWYAFSILFNNIPPGTNGTAKQLQDRVVRAIDNATGGDAVSATE